MSVDFLSIGRHTLDVSSVETASRQICERLGINIAIGEWDDGKFYPQQKIELYPGAPFYRMWDVSSNHQSVQYYLDTPEEYIDSQSGDFSFMLISKETVSIDFWAVSWRWQWYWNLFGDDEEYRADYRARMETDVQAFRKVARKYYSKIGAGYIYCYADQGPSDLIGDYEDESWIEFENAIRTGKYLDDNQKYLEKEWSGFSSKDLHIINVSDFFSGKNVIRSHSWWDIFYDDFADLNV